MTTEKNLFPYNLAVAAIFKNEAPYLREWLDYHLLAGVEHFYLYDNGSTDNFAEVIKPYVESNLVTLTSFDGKIMQIPAYEDALARYRFHCRYMAFIDCDEFIFPKTGTSIVEVADEIFSRDNKVAALGINWQFFGSNGHEAADYSRGVLERFTRRAQSDWTFFNEAEGFEAGNIYIKSVVNPRRVDYPLSPHYAVYFAGLKSLNSNGTETYRAGNSPVVADKIVVNHYYTKSLEEFADKVKRGSACREVNHKKMAMFQTYDRNEVFDDGILTYRNARAENFSLESDEEKFRRVEKTLTEILTQCSPFDSPPEFFVGKLETFLTCRALAELLDVKIGSRAAEEFALVWIYQTLAKAETLTHAELQQFFRALPEILARPFPFRQKLNRLTQDLIIPSFCEELKHLLEWRTRSELINLQKLLRLIN